MPAQSPYISVDPSTPTARVVINRPERRNAMDLAMWKSIPVAIDALSRTPGIRSIVLQGGGDRAFVSGADISEFDEVRCDAKSNEEFTRHVVAATRAIRKTPIPVIAAINGYCIGGGIVLACACDIRIATDDSSFAVPAARLGLGYELENYEALSRLVGPGNAAHMVLTAQSFTAEDALRMGLIQEIVAKDQLTLRIDTLTKDMSHLAPLTLAAAKACALSRIEGDGRAEAQHAIGRCFDSEDFLEGRKAFREKRQPAFAGK